MARHAAHHSLYGDAALRRGREGAALRALSVSLIRFLRQLLFIGSGNPRVESRPSSSDSLLRCAALGLRRACGGCPDAFAELAEILRWRVGRDGEQTPEA